MSSEHQWSLVTADARKATGARSAIRQFLAEQADASSDLDAVEVIVGELVSNVVRHAPGPIGIHCFWDDDDAILIVSDRGPGVPMLRPVPHTEATEGRGFFLIQSLALGMEIAGAPENGTRVCVHLPVRRNHPS